jgi:hypothetical protein
MLSYLFNFNAVYFDVLSSIMLYFFPAFIQVSILANPGIVVTILGESMDVEKSIITNTHMLTFLPVLGLP